MKLEDKNQKDVMMLFRRIRNLEIANSALTTERLLLHAERDVLNIELKHLRERFVKRLSLGYSKDLEHEGTAENPSDEELDDLRKKYRIRSQQYLVSMDKDESSSSIPGEIEAE